MKTVILFAISLFSLSAFAQPNKGNIEALRVAHITREVGLSPQESQKFWPVYNQYQGELENLRKERKNTISQAKQNRSNLSDADYANLVDNEMNFKSKELEIDKKYNERFKVILPIEKVAKLYKAQESFKRELVRQLRDN